MTMTETEIQYNPVAPNGDAILRPPQSGIDPAVDFLFEKALLSDGSFAVTDGTEQDNRDLTVYADPTGEKISQIFTRGGYHPSELQAYGERLRLNAQPNLYNAQTIKRGETAQLTEEAESIVLNGSGELGKSNLIGLIMIDEQTTPDERSYGLIECRGRLFIVTHQHKDGSHDFYSPREIDPDNPDLTNMPFRAAIKETERVHALDVSSDGKHKATLHIPNVERPHEKRDRGVIRGILKGKRARVEKKPLALKAFDMDLASKSIEEAIERKEEQEKWAKKRETEERYAREAQERFSESISIKALSEKHPEAGNLFNPGASIFEDELFIAEMSKFGLGIIRGHGERRFMSLSERDEEIMREKPEVRSAIKKLLKDRLLAWAEENPAQRIKSEYGARQRLDSHSSPHGLTHGRVQSDSLVDHALTEKRTIANLLIPLDDNGPKSSSKRNRKTDDRAHLRSYEYAVNIAYDIIADDWGVEEDLYRDVRYTDKDRKVLIHEAQIAQHRTTARLLVNGEA